jgi:molybdopterin-containing oxidoreductase family iron-sulfur binding subunit
MDSPESTASDLHRRELLRLAGTSLALSGAAACTRQPVERIFPYARRPELLVPGKPLYFATAMPWSLGALGLLVESHMGRPTKVEGNPDHPGSLGATDAFAQASVLELYDPERSQVVRERGRIRPFEAFQNDLSQALEREAGRAGAGLRILTEPVTSLALAAELRAVLAKYPRAVWHQWESANRDAARAASLLAFGQDVVLRPRLDKARVIVSWDADFLGRGPQSVRLARQLARGREAHGANGQRLIVLETTPTLTGAKADRRVPVGLAALARIAGAMASFLGVRVPHAEPKPEELELARAVAAELARAEGAALVLAGEELPAELQALALALTHALGSVGGAASFGPPVAVESVDCGASLEQLVAALRSNAIETLLILGGNPVFDAPADLDFGAALERARFSAHLSLYEDETSARCNWHVPQAHFLESWGDARAFDGSVSLVQPVIAPLYGGKSALELAALVAGHPGELGYERLRVHWRERLRRGEAEFEAAWRSALHDGLVPQSALAPVSVASSLAKLDLRRAGQQVGPSLLLRPDSAVWDGRFSGNAWLQECPRPLTKLVWDNALLLAPRAAARLELSSGDLVRIELGQRSLEAPVWIQPGQAEDVAVMHLGYGKAFGAGAGVGACAETLRLRAELWNAGPVSLTKLGRRQRLVATQEHSALEGRDLIRVSRGGTVASAAAHVTPGAHAGAAHEPASHAAPAHAGAAGDTSMYAPFPTLTTTTGEGQAWGMSIDLDRCTGCNACVVACQAENNIPAVGKEQVAAGREMHWIRIDRYFEGSADDPQILFQPVTCMHCEVAPCEVVCPVGATVHSAEGLNDMVYNRCVGTRYCANNCPYKVRRFNFLRYADLDSESLAAQRNPDVTVRTRGVMEKCTYCVQRISAARIEARKAGRPIQDGEVLTACQQVCPAEAIRFGDVNDPNSQVSRAKTRAGAWALLAELNTRPRTTYLPKHIHPAEGGA